MDKNTSEIAKLTERISRDPKSKLFVPLAEEYKKIGDIEMAVHVLTEGLKNNPGYVTARSFLGRLLFEMGDMTAARRELEEVVKAVPDNLLAQKKLGDLHALAGNQTEALKYYKTAHSLNPADSEIASLVANLEGGVDARLETNGQKVATPSEPAVTSESPSLPQQKTAEQAVTEASVEQAKATGLVEKAAPQKEEPETIPSPAARSTPVAAVEETAGGPSEDIRSSAVVSEIDVNTKESSAITGAVPLSGATSEEPEVAEEVFAVEPLEEDVPSEETSEPPQEPGLLRESETASSDALVDAISPQEEVLVLLEEPESAVGPTDEVSDDLTTDTLAELYIGQGFYEKAIDIYERMLADHPESTALKDKLELVRSLAASSEVQTPHVSREPAAESTILTETPSEHMPPAASTADGEEITLEADLIEEPERERPDTDAATELDDRFAEPKEYRPPSPEAAEAAGTGEEKFIDVVMSPPSREFTGVGTESPAFEPREYIPPDAGLRPKAEEKERVETKQTMAHREEVIVRLENWLKTIKKEI